MFVHIASDKAFRTTLHHITNDNDARKIRDSREELEGKIPDGDYSWSCFLNSRFPYNAQLKGLNSFLVPEALLWKPKERGRMHRALFKAILIGALPREFIDEAFSREMKYIAVFRRKLKVQFIKKLSKMVFFSQTGGQRIYIERLLETERKQQRNERQQQGNEDEFDDEDEESEVETLLCVRFREQADGIVEICCTLDENFINQLTGCLFPNNMKEHFTKTKTFLEDDTNWSTFTKESFENQFTDFLQTF